MLIVERLSGERYELSEENTGLRLTDFTIDSPVTRTETDSIPGLDGHIDLGTTYEGRTMRASFFVFSNDRLDYPLVRNEIFKIFNSKEFFYLIDDREPGKRWFVKYDSSYTINQLIATVGEFEIEFRSNSPYCESIATTLDSLTVTTEIWSVGQGLIVEEPKYIHKSNTFQIYNAGDAEVDPVKRQLVISYKGTSSNLKIKNLTTGIQWTYSGNSTSNDTIKLDGVKSYKNSVSITGDTNFKVIELIPGWNEIKLEGTSGSFEIKFDFRFYYL